MASYEALHRWQCIRPHCQNWLITRGDFQEAFLMLGANGWHRDHTYEQAHSGTPGFRCPEHAN